MNYWYLIIFLVSSLFIGKYLFKRLFNPIFLYAGSWSFIIYMYSLKLIGYSPVSDFTWNLIIVSFLAFLSGILVVYLGRSIYYNNNDAIDTNDKTIPEWSASKQKQIRNFILATAIIGLLVSLQHWYVLINKYGSIAMVFLNARDIYQERVGGEHLGKIPYLNLLSYVSVFMSAIYSAYRNKFSYLVVIAIFAVILADAASLARAGVFFAFVLFGITFITSRYYFKSKMKGEQFKHNKNIIITLIVIVVIALSSVSLIRLIRNPLGDYKSTSIELKELTKSGIISSSIYLYFSSPLSVLSAYLENRDEVAVFGENTFYPVYNVLNKFGAGINLSPYPTGYFVPMWVNSATYLRELDVDFGPAGVFIIPFIIGFLSTYFWYKFFDKGNLLYLTFYCFTAILIVFSVFYIGTRLTVWLFGFIFSILSIIYFEKLKTKHN